jgi:hypothetical protein
MNKKFISLIIILSSLIVFSFELGDDDPKKDNSGYGDENTASQHSSITMQMKSLFTSLIFR